MRSTGRRICKRSEFGEFLAAGIIVFLKNDPIQRGGGNSEPGNQDWKREIEA